MRLRLKDLPKISEESIDVKGVMSEVVGFKKYWFLRKYIFGIALRKAMTLIKNGRALDASTLTLHDDCKIKVPKNIESVSFRAMMELQSEIKNANEDSLPFEVMASVISIACYSENVKEFYDSSCNDFKNFRERVLSEPMEHMIGLYNHICKEIDESQKKWKRMFLSVEVENGDMRKAGVDRMQQFSILTTLKNLCSDFNCNYKEAWQISYATSQTNSYAKATYDHIHENLRILKEHKMRAQRKSKHS
jgi:hypothetical protein